MHVLDGKHPPEDANNLLRVNQQCQTRDTRETANKTSPSP